MTLRGPLWQRQLRVRIIWNITRRRKRDESAANSATSQIIVGIAAGNLPRPPMMILMILNLIHISKLDISNRTRQRILQRIQLKIILVNQIRKRAIFLIIIIKKVAHFIVHIVTIIIILRKVPESRPIIRLGAKMLIPAELMMSFRRIYVIKRGLPTANPYSWRGHLAIVPVIVGVRVFTGHWVHHYI